MALMLIGHAEQGVALRAAFRSGRPHHAWLLAGPAGVGKATFARVAATWALADAAGPPVAADSFEVPASHPTLALIEAGSHLDLRHLVRTLDDKGKLRTVIRVDEVRALQPLLRNRPALSDWRLVIVDSADELNANAANALLKNLEEPPPGTLFLVVSHSPGRLLPTIRSRCRTLRFKPLSDTEVGIVLQAEQPDLPAAEIAALVAVAEGSPGRALGLAASGVDALTRDMDALSVARGGEGSARALALARGLAGRTGAARYTAFLDLAPAYIARAARGRSGIRGRRAVSLWERANDLAAGAVPLAMEPQAVAFELATLVAGLAE